MTRLPFRIQVLHHPQSDAGARFARALFDRFSLSRGPRIPLVYGSEQPNGGPPDRLELDAAEKSVVVVLADKRMARRVAGGSGPAWAKFLIESLALVPPGSPDHCVLPVALDVGAFDLGSELEETSFVRLDAIKDEEKEAELEYRVAVNSLEILGFRVPDKSTVTSDRPRPPVNFFLSHAKQDLPAPGEDGPVGAILKHFADGRVDSWYDAKDIRAGENFAARIESGVDRASALIAVITDSFASREWCRKEILFAKTRCGPVVVVDAVEAGESRAFPYIGNAPTIRWRPGPYAARDVVLAAVREALKFEHHLATLRARENESTKVLPSAPELISIAGLDAAVRRIVYPDPPLGREELELLGNARGDLEFTTPLSELASHRPHSGTRPHRLGLSISGSQDIRAYGVGPEHMAAFADDLALFFLLAGSQLVYGGNLSHGGGDGDEENFVTRLFGAVRSYSPLAKDLGLEDRAGVYPLVNYAPWPLHHAFSDEQYDQFGKLAGLEELERPHSLGVDEGELGVKDGEFFIADTPARRFAWARSLTELRTRLVAETDSRVVLGGKTKGFFGVYPGVLEEAVLTLESQDPKPLFVVGAFGGAGRIVVDMLRGVDREELTTEWAEQNIDDYDAVVDLYARAGIPFRTPESIADSLRAKRALGFAGALRNGLSDEENEELFDGTDPRRLVELVLRARE